MTPAQRALILAALGLTPRDGVMPRWSHRNRAVTGALGTAEWWWIERNGWADFHLVQEAPGLSCFTVTRRGAEAAGVLGRCRREDVRR